MAAGPAANDQRNQAVDVIRHHEQQLHPPITPRMAKTNGLKNVCRNYRLA